MFTGKPNADVLAVLIKSVPDFGLGLVYSALQADEIHYNGENKAIIIRWLREALEIVFKEPNEQATST